MSSNSGYKQEDSVTSNKIIAHEYSLSKIFSSDFEFVIPIYQRPYAWTEEETTTLFDDLFGFFSTEGNDANYFLGSIVLIKENGGQTVAVIDGQQRLVTLTILWAVIASHLTGKSKDYVLKYISEPGNDIEELIPRPRLRLREKDQAFFEKYIQSGNIDKLAIETTNSDAQKHIQKNCALLCQKLNNNCPTEEDVRAFAKFVAMRCCLVAVLVSNQNTAFRVFSVLNSRGLDLLPIDIIKSDIIGGVPPSEQDKYAKKWEDLEEVTTRLGFNDLFERIRMIFVKSKAKKTLLEEFKSSVFVQPNNDPKKFIDEVIAPYAESYAIIKKNGYSAANNAKEINDLLKWLNSINDTDWISLAVYFLKTIKNPDYVLWFFERLERLAAYMQTTAKDVNARIVRYAGIIQELEKKPDSRYENPISTIELTSDEKKEFLNVLGGEIYSLNVVRRNYIIRRLDTFVSDGSAIYNLPVLSVEHVLPQTVSPGSEWATIWPNDEVRQLWLHRIANLVPLNHRKNSEAQNYDFEKKKKVYFTGKHGTCNYSLTNQVLTVSSWTPTVVETRQKELLQVFKDKWHL